MDAFCVLNPGLRMGCVCLALAQGFYSETGSQVGGLKRDIPIYEKGGLKRSPKWYIKRNTSTSNP